MQIHKSKKKTFTTPASVDVLLKQNQKITTKQWARISQKKNNKRSTGGNNANTKGKMNIKYQAAVEEKLHKLARKCISKQKTMPHKSRILKDCNEKNL